jgi:CheY-like chemotaxis protein
MQVLIVDADPSIDESVLRYLHSRNYEATITGAPREALDLIHHNEFDCILVDVSTTAECLGLLEIRQLARRAAVAFMTTTPVETLVAEAVAEGSIEFQPFPILVGDFERFDQPIMYAGATLPRTLFLAARDKGLRLSTARTLQFAMNLLVDGWCQIPGRARPDQVAIIHHVGAKQLAILASGVSDSTPAITCCRKPQRAVEFVAVLQHIVGNSPTHCGLAEARRRRYDVR